MKMLLVTLLLPCVVFAAPDPRVTRGNFLRIPAYETLGPQTYFVAPGGDDNSACTGVSACATIPGALSKIPKLVRHLTTVSVAAGTYSGFIVSGFSADDSVNSPVGLLIQGTLVNSTIATGSPTGTATGGSGGANQAFGTLVDSGATWTTNDLIGRLLCTNNSNPLGCFPIEANTSTVITVMAETGINGFVTPVNGTGYAVMDSATIINTAVTLPGTPIAAAQANRAAIIAIDTHALGGREGFVTFANMQLAPVTGRGVLLGGTGGYALNQMQVRPQASGFAAITTTGGIFNFPLGSPFVTIENSDIALLNSTSTIVNWGAATTLNIVGSQIRGNSTASTQFGVFAGGPLNMQVWEVSGTTNGVWFVGSGAFSSVTSSGHINCSTYTGSTALTVGNSSTVAGVAGVQGQAVLGSIDHVQLSVCGIGLLVDGAAAAELHGFVGSVGTTLIEVTNGGYAGVNQTNLTTASVQFGDGGTGQFFVDLDNGTVTATSSTDLGAFQNLGICISNLGSGSRACGR